ncbi:MAG: methanogenesis marker 9 domain-containing protein [Methanospirillaceae archaeon]|nr:methanogenesis marker 9 domain-containing protein [Methanospirillaceae archaeon]
MEDKEISYDLTIGEIPVPRPIAIASMAGYTDAEYLLQRGRYIGIGFIGGYSIDEPTIIASEEMFRAGRQEFLPDDPIREIENQAGKLKNSGFVTGINLRAANPQSLVTVAEALGPEIVYEIDAHCRHEAMKKAGSGESLLTDPKRLIAQVQSLKITGVFVSVKIRAGVCEDDPKLAHDLWKAGADCIHVDLMDLGTPHLKAIRNACPIRIIANNSVNGYERAKDYFAHGADLVSLARKSDISTLSQLDSDIRQYVRDHGWYNAPKQLCRGGDIRALTFCCMPVKPCPLLPLLNRYKITPQEFVEMKMEGVKGTPLLPGENTCFGSLAYCCKDSTPCMFRDLALRQAGLKKSAYMDEKRKLSEKIIQKIFS